MLIDPRVYKGVNLIIWVTSQAQPANTHFRSQFPTESHASRIAPAQLIILPTAMSQSSMSSTESYESRQHKLADVDTVAQFLRRGTNETAMQTEFEEIEQMERHYSYFFRNQNYTQFDNIATFDEEAVELPARDGGRAFIHASHIKTSEGSNYGDYIIAQAPLVNPPKPRRDTQSRWYKMIWDYGVLVCVSCVDLGKEERCDFYFNPKRGGTYSVDRFHITTLDARRESNWCWTLYVLRIANREAKEERDLRLIVCGGKHVWLDNPVTNMFTHRDLANLLTFVWTIEDDAHQQWRRATSRSARRQRPPPTLVHSRAGINRAGVYIAASIFGKQIRDTENNKRRINKVRVIALCRRMRQARCDVLGRREHYVMLLRTILELGVREGLVRREDTERARQVLHRMLAEIQSRTGKVRRRKPSASDHSDR